MKTRKVFTGMVLLACVAIMLITIGCAPSTQQQASGPKTLKLGCLMPFSGPAAMYGERGRKITDVYIELVNEDGGVKIGNDTYKIDLRWGDDAFTPAGAAAAARKIIYDDGVTAILGYLGPGFSALSPVTNPEKVLLFTRTGGIIYSPKKDPYVVLGTPTGEITLNQAIAIMQAHPDLHTLAWTGTMDDRRIAESAFKLVDDRLEKEYGIKSVRVYYPSGTTNFTPYLSKMAEQGAEVVFVGATVLDVALIAKQRWQMGYKWPVAQTSDNLADIYFGICGKEAAQGIMGNRVNPLELKKVTVAKKYLDMTQRIIDRYNQKYGVPMDN
ncbi:MAG: ABC transporter substrate-binding protein, partial [Syntrophales bacterium]|nr:ABC transporter substrate-binding protein [Syntrophales bacterium]